MAVQTRSVRKHEYIDGEIRLMSYTSENHGILVANLIGLFFNCFKGTYCRVYPSDRMLYVPQTGNYYYPDVMVVCGELQFHPYKLRMKATLNPMVLIEVLSETTGEFDEMMKWYNYKQIDSLQQYVLVSQNEVRLDVHTRVSSSNDWLNTFAEQLDQTIIIAGCELRVRDVYEPVKRSS